MTRQEAFAKVKRLFGASACIDVGSTLSSPEKREAAKVQRKELLAKHKGRSHRRLTTKREKRMIWLALANLGRRLEEWASNKPMNPFEFIDAVKMAYGGPKLKARI